MFFSSYQNKNDDPIHVLTEGQGGTWKSRVINAIKEFLKRTNELHKLKILAPTGTAAFQIGGNTIHKALGMGFGGVGSKRKRNSANVTTSYNIHSFWDEIKFIIIDEISMVSCDLLDKLDELLRQKYQKNIPFAGKSIFYFGDFYQHPPVASRPIFDSNLWNKITHAVRLSIQVRAINDQQYVSFLSSLRMKNVTSSQEEYLNSRMISNYLGSTEEWYEAPLITTTNEKASKANSLRTAMYACKTKQTKIIICAEDTIDKKRIQSKEVLRIIQENYSFIKKNGTTFF